MRAIVDERWDRTEAVPLIKLRASFIQINPSSQQHQVDWNTIDQSNMETQKQIPVMSSVKVMEQIITGGVDVLRQKVNEGTDLKTLRKKNGMSVLHVAASTASEGALEIVKEIIQNRYIDVNDVNGVRSERLPSGVGLYLGASLRGLQQQRSSRFVFAGARSGYHDYGFGRHDAVSARRESWISAAVRRIDGPHDHGANPSGRQAWSQRSGAGHQQHARPCRRLSNHERVLQPV